MLSASAAWLLLGRSLSAQFSRLAELRDDPKALESEALRHQLAQFTICDLAASPGIFMFLLQGEILALAAFALASEVFYLRVFPSDLRLGEAIFRGERR